MTQPPSRLNRKQFESDLREAIECLFGGDNLMMSFQLSIKYYYKLPSNWLLHVIVYYTTFYSDDALNCFMEEDKAKRGLSNFDKDTYLKKVFGEGLIDLRRLSKNFKRSHVYPEMGVLAYRLLGLYEDSDMIARYNAYSNGAELGKGNTA